MTFTKAEYTERFIDIRTRREALYITQAEMAATIGVSRLTYGSYEKDYNKIPLGKYLFIEDIIIRAEQKKRDLTELKQDNK